MKGLLLKDWYAVRHYYKWMMVMLVGFGIYAGVNMKGDSFWMAYMMLVTALIPVNLLGLDEKSGWSDYSMTFPLSAGQVVGSKYLLGILFLMGEMVLCFGAGNIYAMTHGITISAGSMETLFEAMILVGICPMAINFPVSYKFGVDKGRMVVFASIVLLFAVVSIINEKIPINIHRNIQNIERILTIVAIASFVISYKISVQICRRKN